MEVEVYLDTYEAAVLEALRQQYPILQTVATVAVDAGVSPKVAARSVNGLVDMGLAIRPRGSHKGATLTGPGLQLANQLRANRPGYESTTKLL